MKSNLYRYVYESGNGWIIQKNHEHYGWYDKLPDALYERDRLEACEWDLGEWVYMRDTENPYKYIQLPPKELGLRNPMQYIRCRNNRFQVIKRINGKQYSCGTYDTLEKAIEVRNYLIKNNWRMDDEHRERGN